MLAIVHADLVMPDHIIPDAYLTIEDGLIKDFGTMYKFQESDKYEIFDAQGAYVGPGLVDIHAHAGGTYNFHEEPGKAAQHMLKHGTTTVLPTLSYSMDRQSLLEAVALVKKVMNGPDGINIGGIYMEGPYLNPKFGANRDRISWNKAALREEYAELIELCGQDVRIWAVAPERENIKQFMEDVKKTNPNVRFTVAHSEATPQQVEELIPYGLCIGTHHTNATGTLNKYPECRGVCVDEAVNYNNEIYAELICDRKGVHVDPYMLRLVRRIKGDDRIILITDAGVDDGPIPETGYEGVTDLIFDRTGEISGTQLTLNAACYNMMLHTGASIVDAFKLGSRNPARVAGLLDRGEIRRGLRADLVVVDYKMNVQNVFLKGFLQ